jgi:uncharacterized protein YbaP (TraB family)
MPSRPVPVTRRWRAALAVTLAVITFGASALAQARAPRGFIWTVERDGRTSWLVGSIHVLPADAHPFPASMERAFGQAKTLLEEIDVNDAGSLELMAGVLAKGMLPSGQTLATVLPQPAYQKLAKRLADGGLPIEIVQSMQPWLAEVTIDQIAWQHAGFDPNLGPDMYYRGKATEKGLAFGQLETAAEQIDFLAGEPLTAQVEQLTKSLDNGDVELTALRDLTAAWRAGDVPAIERILLEDAKDSPAAFQTLVVDRNRRWIPKLEGCFATGNCFVVVGAAHIVGSDGLIALLRQKGYRITRQ